MVRWVVLNWNLDILGSMLWDSRSDLHLLFYLAYSDTNSAGEEGIYTISLLPEGKSSGSLFNLYWCWRLGAPCYCWPGVGVPAPSQASTNTSMARRCFVTALHVVSTHSTEWSSGLVTSGWWWMSWISTRLPRPQQGAYGGPYYFLKRLEVQAPQVVSTDTTVGGSSLLLAEVNVNPSYPLSLLWASLEPGKGGNLGSPFNLSMMVWVWVAS